MKHLLNNLSEEEKNSIREQHEGGMKIDTSRFRTLLESKSGNVKPLVERFDDEDEDDTCPQCGRGGYSYESGCEDCDDEENEYRWDAEDELDEMVGVDYMSDELEEDFEGEEKPLNLVQRFFMYNKENNPELSDIPEDEWDEFIEDMSDETTSKIMADIMRYRNPEFKEFEAKELGYDNHDGSFDGDDSEFEDDLGYAQHDGGFDGDDSEFEDEDEELDLREFDNLEDDGETW